MSTTRTVTKLSFPQYDNFIVNEDYLNQHYQLKLPKAAHQANDGQIAPTQILTDEIRKQVNFEDSYKQLVNEFNTLKTLIEPTRRVEIETQIKQLTIKFNSLMGSISNTENKLHKKLKDITNPNKYLKPTEYIRDVLAIAVYTSAAQYLESKEADKKKSKYHDEVYTKFFLPLAKKNSQFTEYSTYLSDQKDINGNFITYKTLNGSNEEQLNAVKKAFRNMTMDEINNYIFNLRNECNTSWFVASHKAGILGTNLLSARSHLDHVFEIDKNQGYKKNIESESIIKLNSQINVAKDSRREFCLNPSAVLVDGCNFLTCEKSRAEYLSNNHLVNIESEHNAFVNNNVIQAQQFVKEAEQIKSSISEINHSIDCLNSEKIFTAQTELLSAVKLYDNQYAAVEANLNKALQLFDNILSDLQNISLVNQQQTVNTFDPVTLACLRGMLVESLTALKSFNRIVQDNVTKVSPTSNVEEINATIQQISIFSQDIIQFDVAYVAAFQTNNSEKNDASGLETLLSTDDELRSSIHLYKNESSATENSFIVSNEFQFTQNPEATKFRHALENFSQAVLQFKALFNIYNNAKKDFTHANLPEIIDEASISAKILEIQSIADVAFASSSAVNNHKFNEFDISESALDNNINNSNTNNMEMPVKIYGSPVSNQIEKAYNNLRAVMVNDFNQIDPTSEINRFNKLIFCQLITHIANNFRYWNRKHDGYKVVVKNDDGSNTSTYLVEPGIHKLLKALTDYSSSNFSSNRINDLTAKILEIAKSECAASNKKAAKKSRAIQFFEKIKRFSEQSFNNENFLTSIMQTLDKELFNRGLENQAANKQFNLYQSNYMNEEKISLNAFPQPPRIKPWKTVTSILAGIAAVAIIATCVVAPYVGFPLLIAGAAKVIGITLAAVGITATPTAIGVAVGVTMAAAITGIGTVIGLVAKKVFSKLKNVFHRKKAASLEVSEPMDQQAVSEYLNSAERVNPAAANNNAVLDNKEVPVPKKSSIDKNDLDEIEALCNESQVIVNKLEKTVTDSVPATENPMAVDPETTFRIYDKLKHETSVPIAGSIKPEATFAARTMLVNGFVEKNSSKKLAEGFKLLPTDGLFNKLNNDTMVATSNNNALNLPASKDKVEYDSDHIAIGHN